ncbi:MAG: SDR family NAD(P)-dependent oxidoreductase [Bacteroidales bacterium]|nr:SDR family NAD(P)-dependent oxidoreductase [Bacteroidales bacterium]
MGKWTAENIPRQDNRKVVITGANSGIGFEMARMLALKGAVVIMACRNLDKAAKAEAKIRRSYPDADLSVMHLDLSSLDSVKSFAAGYKKIHTGLDILINNAGVMATPHRKTEDGFEWQFGINHLGHFALTGHLLDLLINTRGLKGCNGYQHSAFQGRDTFR